MSSKYLVGDDALAHLDPSGTSQKRLSFCGADPVSFCFVLHEPRRREIEKKSGPLLPPPRG